MKVFAISDLHVDYQENKEWLFALSAYDYTGDVLILAGDVTDVLTEKERVFAFLSRRFHKVLYVPGNHDLWIRRCDSKSSLHKFKRIQSLAADHGIGMSPQHFDDLSIVPLFSWYDYTFGMPSEELYARWVDFMVCQWPDGFSQMDINQYFLALNEKSLAVKNSFIISFSHFLPREDLIPRFVPFAVKSLLPVMGSTLLEMQLRRLCPRIHVYGHSHFNRQVEIENIQYINNAYGYPHEWRITTKALQCIHET